MKNNEYQTKGAVINIKDVLWSLLEQWKAILIVALILALIVPSLAYLRDKKAYDQMMEEIKLAEEKRDTPREKQIEEVLSQLTYEDRTLVERVMREQELIRTQEDYLNESLWLNNNPSSQRTLTLKYYVKGDADATNDLPTLEDSISALLKKSELMKSLRDTMELDVDLKYMYELITAYGRYYTDGSRHGGIYTIEIILPENADADAVQKVIDDYLKKYHDKLVSKVGAHTVTLLNCEDTYLYNTDAVDRRVKITTNINTLQTSVRSYIATMNEDQRTALDAVNAIDASFAMEANPSEEKDVESEEEVVLPEDMEVPAFSIKNAILGFMLGLFFYVCAFLLKVFIGGKLLNADQLEGCAGSRSVGSLYYHEKQKGIRALLQSDAVCKKRYKNAGDITSQMKAAISTMQAVCEHISADKITLLRMTGADGEEGRLSKEFEDEAKAAGIETEVVEVSGQIDENTLLPVKKALIVAGSNNKFDAVSDLSRLCRVYDIDNIGSLFIGRQ